MPINRENVVRFFGFDSFDGFDNLSESEQHPFYIDEQFKTSYELVKNKVSRLSKKYSLDAYLIKGFLKDTLRYEPSKYGINNESFQLQLSKRFFFPFLFVRNPASF